MLFRKEKIVSLCKNKSVLHLGFVQHSDQFMDMINKGTWLHEMIDTVSSKLVGLDFLNKEVNFLKENYGYEAYYADVTKLEDVELEEKFDVIVCGELIEHLDNPGLMLDGIKRFMHEDSLLIITTPNPWSKNRLKLINRQVLESSWLNPEHTCWFSYQTLKQLLERYAYVEDFYGYSDGHTSNEFYTVFKSPLLNKIKALKIKIFKTPKINSNGLFFVAKLPKI
ncbi:MAG: hypothetical protein BalsKO_32120 [Balneolaceae bacterium]